MQILRSGIEAIRYVLLNGIHHASRSGKPQAGRNEGERLLRGLVPWYHHCAGLSVCDFALGYGFTQVMDREDIISKKLAHMKLRFDPTGRFTVRGVCHGVNLPTCHYRSSGCSCEAGLTRCD